jgi:transcriptional regulator with XRE-family HTH domain
MQASAIRRSTRHKPSLFDGPRRVHARDHSRPRDNRPKNGTYRDTVATPLDPAVARARFAVFITRALEQARANGMTDSKIQEVSGVGTSTFHRWRRGSGRDLPQIDRVRRFCAAVGASIDDALAALGMTDAAPMATPEPPLPREIRIIMRRLTDPNVAEVEKDFIRRSLQMLAGQVSASERAEQKARDAG